MLPRYKLPKLPQKQTQMPRLPMEGEFNPPPAPAPRKVKATTRKGPARIQDVKLKKADQQVANIKKANADAIAEEERQRLQRIIATAPTTVGLTREQQVALNNMINQKRVNRTCAQDKYDLQRCKNVRAKSRAKNRTKALQNPWVQYVKEYARLNNMGYRDALKVAGPSYRAQKTRAQTRGRGKGKGKGKGKKGGRRMMTETQMKKKIQQMVSKGESAEDIYRWARNQAGINEALSTPDGAIFWRGYSQQVADAYYSGMFGPIDE